MGKFRRSPFDTKAWCLLVICIASFLGYFAPGPLNMRGVVVGMSESEVKRHLGKPATCDGYTWMYYFGPLAAGSEYLQIEFGSDKRVKAVEGEQISKGWRVVSTVSDPEAKIFQEFGPLRKRVRNEITETCYFADVEISLKNGRVWNIALR